MFFSRRLLWPCKCQGSCVFSWSGGEKPLFCWMLPGKITRWSAVLAAKRKRRRSSEELYTLHTVDGGNPAPLGMVNVPCFTGFHMSLVGRISSINRSAYAKEANNPFYGHTKSSWSSASLIQPLNPSETLVLRSYISIESLQKKEHLPSKPSLHPEVLHNSSQSCKSKAQGTPSMPRFTPRNSRPS